MRKDMAPSNEEHQALSRQRHEKRSNDRSDHRVSRRTRARAGEIKEYQVKRQTD